MKKLNRNSFTLVRRKKTLCFRLFWIFEKHIKNVLKKWFLPYGGRGAQNVTDWSATNSFFMPSLGMNDKYN